MANNESSQAIVDCGCKEKEKEIRQLAAKRPAAPPKCNPWNNKQGALQVLLVDEQGNPVSRALVTTEYTNKKGKTSKQTVRTTIRGAICFSGAWAIRADSCQITVTAKRYTPNPWTESAKIEIAKTTVVTVVLTKKLCNPQFLPAGTTVKAKDGTEFTAEDINYAARVVYGEASNNSADRLAVASVIFNRLNKKEFPPKASTLKGVVTQRRQFEAVTKPKFRNSAPGKYEDLADDECASLGAAISAMKSVVENGPSNSYTFFLAATATDRGTLIGGNRFW